MASRRADPQRPPLESRGDCAPHGHWEFLHAASPPKPAESAGDYTPGEESPDPCLGKSQDQPTHLLDPPTYVGPESRWVRGIITKIQKASADYFSLLASSHGGRFKLRPGGSGPAYRSDPPAQTRDHHAIKTAKENFRACPPLRFSQAESDAEDVDDTLNVSSREACLPKQEVHRTCPSTF